ncbi:MAG TPA: hypothetical protein VE645_09275, partial [Pseudonocardiaceae bacterium]|nr:hypothetical protein [Pseudonocardiaceae bacterium]
RRVPTGAYSSAGDPQPLVHELLRSAGIVFRAALSTARRPRKKRAAKPRRPDTARTKRSGSAVRVGSSVVEVRYPSGDGDGRREDSRNAEAATETAITAQP